MVDCDGHVYCWNCGMHDKTLPCRLDGTAIQLYRWRDGSLRGAPEPVSVNIISSSYGNDSVALIATGAERCAQACEMMPLMRSEVTTTDSDVVHKQVRHAIPSECAAACRALAKG